jgi:hypothetical protein
MLKTMMKTVAKHRLFMGPVYLAGVVGGAMPLINKSNVA